MLDEIPSGTKAEVIDKRKARDWFKVRKYVVNRIRKGDSQASAARWAGVSLGFVNKWWNIWKRTKSWDALRYQVQRTQAGARQALLVRR